MYICYSDQNDIPDIESWLFLAGPTCRPPHEDMSWRPQAIEILKKLQYWGGVSIPEPKVAWPDYEAQVEWEEKHLKMASCIVFWIPRDLTGDTYGCPMQGLTTNDEFGTWKNSGKVVLGCPPNADNIKYQLYYAKKLGIPTAYTLEDTLKLAIIMMHKNKLENFLTSDNNVL